MSTRTGVAPDCNTAGKQRALSRGGQNVLWRPPRPSASSAKGSEGPQVQLRNPGIADQHKDTNIAGER